MFRIWGNRKAWRYLLIVVSIIALTAAVIVYILKRSEVLKVTGIEEKYLYYYDSLYTNNYRPVMVAENISRAKEIVALYSGDMKTIVVGEDIQHLNKPLAVQVLSYSKDSAIVEIYAKYKYGELSSTKVISGYVPAFMLHEEPLVAK